jgi:hypothetical protein
MCSTPRRRSRMPSWSKPTSRTAGQCRQSGTSQLGRGPTATCARPPGPHPRRRRRRGHGLDNPELEALQSASPTALGGLLARLSLGLVFVVFVRQVLLHLVTG